MVAGLISFFFNYSVNRTQINLKAIVIVILKRNYVIHDTDILKYLNVFLYLSKHKILTLQSFLASSVHSGGCFEFYAFMQK